MENPNTIKLLVVDDHQVLIDGIMALLEKAEGISIMHQALNGKGALEALEKHHLEIDLILLDINMPGMNGFDFLAAYEQAIAAGLAAAPVAIVSSSPDAPDRDRAFAFAPVCDYIVKPLDAQSVDDILARLPV